jgi:hypothetical protein
VYFLWTIVDKLKLSILGPKKSTTYARVSNFYPGKKKRTYTHTNTQVRAD